MKAIPLTQGQVAIVDDGDYERVAEYKWYAKKHGKTYYAVRKARVNGKWKRLYMHQAILGQTSLFDHRNLNGLDNQRHNLRPASHRQNSWNRRSSNRNGFKGVFRQRSGNWTARIMHYGTQANLGTFGTLSEAAHAYDLAAKRLFGDFAQLNFP